MLNRKTNSSAPSLKKHFYNATDAHVDYIRKASKGLGVDRHLFGLQMILAEQQQQQGNDGTAPQVALFQDPLFVKSKQWLVSTSTLPSNPGFGPVVIPEGVGSWNRLRCAGRPRVFHLHLVPGSGTRSISLPGRIASGDARSHGDRRRTWHQQAVKEATRRRRHKHWYSH